MGTFYDNPELVKKIKGNTGKQKITNNENLEKLVKEEHVAELKNALVDSVQVGNVIPSKELETENLEIRSFYERSENAMRLVDDIVLKNYLTKLEQMEILPCADKRMDDIILFKINKMVYEKDEYATDKFISVVSAMTYADCSIFLLVEGLGDTTDFYLGIKSGDDKRGHSSIAATFRNSILGQFPGAVIDDYSRKKNTDEKSTPQEHLLNRITMDVACVSSCVGIPSYKNSKGEYTNANFIQGIEKFAMAMQGKKYTAIILATNTGNNEIVSIRNGYENIYTELSAMATRQLAYSTNESLANAISRTKGYSDTHTTSVSKGFSDGISENKSKATSDSVANNHTEGESKDNLAGKLSKTGMGVGGGLATVGMALTATGVGAAIGLPLMAIGGTVTALGALARLGAKTKNKSDSTTITKSTSYTDSKGYTHTETETTTVSDAHTDQFSETNGETSTIGTSKNFTMTIQNKHILEVQKRIDKQLERIELCESSGLWSAGAYFLSYDTDRATAEIGATIYRSIMQGEQSGIENSAINTWYNNKETQDTFDKLLDYVSSLSHPTFKYQNKNLGAEIAVLPTSLLSSKEVAIMIGLPRKSVPGLPVVEHISLAKEVVRLDSDRKSEEKLELGSIFDQGVVRNGNKVTLDIKSLTQHTFVTGSTGCGKSNTIYYLIDQLRKDDKVKFMVIEPAKGEYKDVFGTEHIYGTNPLKSPLLKINPFRFPDGVHVLEHIDRLIEIFNVCWPMYAAMPAVLKEAILNAYEDCGWDLYNSKNKYSNELFPTFADLLNELILVINTSAYSEEVKSNYQGSLVTRVKSLNNGICKQIFSGQEIGDAELFDKNVIVDLSRIGSQETKSLIMGILIMRLNEYRANSGIEHNSRLRHITILEEAHNILKRCSQEQSMEGSNVAGKSVEMISNAIAEMRTYGEGFVIVDQSPGAVDVSAIRNTNTKIIMRLPEENDRKVAGKASAVKDNQIDEIAKLPTGVAVVYQNDWEAPVLCKIGKFEGQEFKFNYIPKEEEKETVDNSANVEILKFLLNGRVKNPIDIDIDKVWDIILKSNLSTYNITTLCDAVEEFKKDGDLHLWKDYNFEKLSKLVTEIISAKTEVKRIASITTNFEELTQKLFELIKDKVADVPEYLLRGLSQCLMRDYSLDSETHRMIYNAWYQTMKG